MSARAKMISVKKSVVGNLPKGQSYAAWIVELKRRYRATQIKAAVAVNSALIEFYWNLGKDISEKYPGEVYGSKFFDKLGVDLRRELPGASGFSKVNLIYCLKFYELYSGCTIVPQLVEQSVKSKHGTSKIPQVVVDKMCNRPLHNWFWFHGGTTVQSSTSAKATATRPSFTCVAQSRMVGAAIRF